MPMHAVHKVLADRARPVRDTVTPGEYLEVEPDAYSAILGVNAGEVNRLAADLEELGVKELPHRDRIYANSDHASPAPTAAFAASQKAWRDFYRERGIRVFDGGMGVSHLVMVEQGIVVPGSMAIAVDSHGPTMGAVGCLTVSLGGVSSYMQPDAVTLDWVSKRTTRAFRVYETDPDFAYETVYDVDVTGIEPQIAVPHSPDDVKPVAAVEGTPIDQAYLGSCASGRLEDFAAAARVLRGRKVHPDIRFIATPGSREVLKEATRLGYISTLHEANAIVTNANCGACPGLHGGILGPGEVAITSITRNFEGRMGAGGSIYLASPATVAASAIEGKIASPLRCL